MHKETNTIYQEIRKYFAPKFFFMVSKHFLLNNDTDMEQLMHIL